MPEKLAELRKRWERWDAQLEAPKWIRQDASTQRSGRGSGGGRGRGQFNRLDANGDGVLTEDEVPQPALFRRMDADGDGKVTLDEARATAGNR